MTPKESGELCLLSGLLGHNRDIFFPKLSEHLHLTTFAEIARRYLKQKGFVAHECQTEEEAREMAKQLVAQKRWPCYFFESDTTGEKDFEEFFTADETLDMERFQEVGVIKNNADFNEQHLDAFENGIMSLRESRSWDKEHILSLFFKVLPDFAHQETGKYLDQRM